jgi:hypothetical protein
MRNVVFPERYDETGQIMESEMEANAHRYINRVTPACGIYIDPTTAPTPIFTFHPSSSSFVFIKKFQHA